MPNSVNQTQNTTYGRILPLSPAVFHSGFSSTSGKKISEGGKEAMLSDVMPAGLCLTSATEHPLAAVDGWPVNVATEAEAVEKITSAAARGESFAVFTLNLDHLVKLRSSAIFRNAYMHARFVTADGEPVARLARRQHSLIQRTTGADLVVPLARAAAEMKLPVYLFGTSPQVIAESATDLAERCNGQLDIVGSGAPPMGFDPEGPDADAALDRIAASGARLCFVALGAPKQEIFAARAVARGVKTGFVCIGAALDFIAGEQSRAPAIMQRNGLEWLWRLASSPRRLGWRYMSCALLLADIMIFGPGSGPKPAKPLAD
jgi:exopolysaccharide biosynthesis WecB/TagA/CpsF family protein